MEYSGTVILPLEETTGDGSLLITLVGAAISEFPFMGRDLPAESCLFGSVVLRLGGVSRGKSGGIMGRRLVRGLGPGDEEVDLDETCTVEMDVD